VPGVGLGHHVRRPKADGSAGDRRKADRWIIARGRDGFQCHVAAALVVPTNIYPMHPVVSWFLRALYGWLRHNH
jgi:hypothetical protein